MRRGCPNCESYLYLAGRFEQIQECTSSIFEGLITLQDPERSWVAKWQRLEGYVPGTYAVKVIGVVSLLPSLPRPFFPHLLSFSLFPWIPMRGRGEDRCRSFFSSCLERDLCKRLASLGSW